MTIQEIKGKDFNTEVLEADCPVMLVFWAEWCGPCKRYKQFLEDTAKSSHLNIKVCRINIDEETDFANKLKIAGVPTTLFYNEGEYIGRKVGVQSIKDIREILWMA